MAPRNWVYMVVGVSLFTLTSCAWLERFSSSAPNPANPIATISPSSSPSSADAAHAATPSPVQPTNRVVTLQVEGQPIETELKLFNPATLPLTTYLPTQDFQSEINTVANGQDIRFYFSPTGQKDSRAYMQIFLPQSNTLDGLRDMVLGDQGLMATNQWELVDRTDVVSYPWAKEKFIYQHKTPNGTAVGTIYLGESQGKPFYVLTHYLEEYTEGFEPRSAIILENLQFKK
jgi:hypothetical protein